MSEYTGITIMVCGYMVFVLIALFAAFYVTLVAIRAILGWGATNDSN